MFPPSFMLLQQEGYLISSTLSLGLNELRSAGVHNKGAFYSALFNLSIGVERLLKATVIIEHMFQNKLSVPSQKQLQAYGHNIHDLYDKCTEIAKSYNVQVEKRGALNEIQQEILDLLNEFARNTTRYYNLDALSSSQGGTDPLSKWGEIIILILSQDVTEKQREKILAQAHRVAKEVEKSSSVLMHGLDQTPLNTKDLFSLPSLHDQAVKHAVLHIINILSPLRDLISSLSHRGYGLGLSIPAFPQMQEFLPWLWNDRQYVLRKKRWP